MCPLPGPTVLPTKAPVTSFPSVPPTVKPTALPTYAPSRKPTTAPTYGMCPCGTYLDSATGLCVKCESGLYNPGIGAVSSAACASCPTGSFPHSTACSCDFTAQPTLSPSKGKPTPQPTDSPTLAPTEIPCPCGTFSATGTGLCNACPAGTFMPNPGASGCYDCPNGQNSFPGNYVFHSLFSFPYSYNTLT